MKVPWNQRFTTAPLHPLQPSPCDTALCSSIYLSIYLSIGHRLVDVRAEVVIVRESRSCQSSYTGWLL